MTGPAATTAVTAPAAIAVLAAIAALAAPGWSPAGSLVAQTVEGVVTEVEQGRPVAGATLLLVDDDGAAVDTATADRAGRFRLDAPAAGAYTVYFQLDGWASVPSDPVELREDATTALDFEVPLISGAAMRQMGDMIRMEPELQDRLPEICGDAFRPWEAGLLVGIVRVRATREPIAGARVAVATGDDGVVRSTLSNERGTYILCDVPPGSDVRITAEAPDGTRETIEVEIRAGTASWYDLPLGPRRP